MTVQILDSRSESAEKFAIIELNINDVYDVVNAMNVLVAQKEEEITVLGDQVDAQDKLQLRRYKDCLKGFQDVKAKIK